MRLHTRRCFSSALATILYVVHGKPKHSMGDVFDSDPKVDLLQIASQLTQRGDPLAASGRIAQQFTTVTLRLKKLADGIEANPKISTNICLLWQADQAQDANKMQAHEALEHTTQQMNRWCSSLPSSALRYARCAAAPWASRGTYERHLPGSGHSYVLTQWKRCSFSLSRT